MSQTSIAQKSQASRNFLILATLFLGVGLFGLIAPRWVKPENPELLLLFSLALIVAGAGLGLISLFFRKGATS